MKPAERAKQRKEIAKAIRLTWTSLESHLPWIDEEYQKRNRKHGDSIGGIHFHRRCIREYASTIATLSNSL